MSTTANSSNLFDSYKQRLASADEKWKNHGRLIHQSGSLQIYGQGSGETREDVLNEIQSKRRSKAIELESAERMRGRNTAMSNARSAFAAGAASRSRKLFRPKGAKNFGAIGKTDAATEAAIVSRQKEIAGLDELDPLSDINEQKRQRQRDYNSQFAITGVRSLGFF